MRLSRRSVTHTIRSSNIMAHWLATVIINRLSIYIFICRLCRILCDIECFGEQGKQHHHLPSISFKFSRILFGRHRAHIIQMHLRIYFVLYLVFWFSVCVECVQMAEVTRLSHRHLGADYLMNHCTAFERNVDVMRNKFLRKKNTNLDCFHFSFPNNRCELKHPIVVSGTTSIFDGTKYFHLHTN